MPLRPDLLAQFQRHNNPPKEAVLSLSELAKLAIEQNIADGKIESIPDRLETAKQELYTFAEFFTQNETNPQRKQQAIDIFMSDWEIVYNDETDAIETWKLNSAGSRIPVNNSHLNISNKNLKGSLSVPSHLQLASFYCSNNQLTTLDNLPASLTGLYCSNNQLTTLDSLPAGLTKLNCSDNRLTNSAIAKIKADIPSVID